MTTILGKPGVPSVRSCMLLLHKTKMYRIVLRQRSRTSAIEASGTRANWNKRSRIPSDYRCLLLMPASCTEYGHEDLNNQALPAA